MDEKDIVNQELQQLLGLKEQQNKRLKLKVKVCIQKLTEQEAFIQGQKESEFTQLHFQVQTLTQQLEEAVAHKERVENAYEYMWQNHTEKNDASKQLILQMKQDHYENVEKCSREVEMERGMRAKLEI